jgi:hypothetical protein
MLPSALVGKHLIVFQRETREITKLAKKNNKKTFSHI